MIKNIKIGREDCFPKEMKISQIKLGNKTLLGESTTGFVGKNMRDVLSHVFNLNGNWSNTARHLAFTIKNRIEKEEGFDIPEDDIWEKIKKSDGRILKKIYRRGFYTFNFEVIPLPLPEVKKSEIKEVEEIKEVLKDLIALLGQSGMFSKERIEQMIRDLCS